ncbi:hypothetical protein Godav_000172, partial [Gossypium davidsonii]|nr:hypothetical protein [Gossypium davidsonii]
DNIYWLVGNGLRVKSWKDNWIDIGPLVNLIPTHTNLDLGCLLKDMVIEEDTSLVFPHLILQQDLIELLGAKSGSGSFSIKSAYKMLTEMRRDVGVEEHCTVCGLFANDVLHAIRDCSEAKDVWSQIIPTDKQEYWALQCNSMHKKYQFRRSKSRSTSSRTDDWTRLYSDRVAKVGFEDVVAGVIFRDQHGNWILGFNRQLCQCSVFNAKL